MFIYIHRNANTIYTKGGTVVWSFYLEVTLMVTIQIAEYSNGRKNQGHSKRRKNSITAIIFRL